MTSCVQAKTEGSLDFLTDAIDFQIRGCREESFFIAQVANLHKRHKLWVSTMPNIRPYYAVKANQDLEMLRQLAMLSCGFDCASRNEIDRVLGIGVDPDSIIFANPCKQEQHLKHARKCGVERITFDSVEELHKTKELYPHAKCILRLAVDDSDAVFQFSQKFGASMDRVPLLLAESRRLGLDIIGISFHVGSGNGGSTAHADAVVQAYEAFQMAEAEGYNIQILDIGGGWPGHPDDDGLFAEMAHNVLETLRLFPKHVKTIAEPGRFFAESYLTLATRVHSRRRRNNQGPNAYHVSQGVKGCLKDALYEPGCFDKKVSKFSPKTRLGGNDSDNARFVDTMLLGPSDHPLDCLVKQVSLPELHIGDWVVFNDIGAYTSVFDDNGPHTIYIHA